MFESSSFLSYPISKKTDTGEKCLKILHRVDAGVMNETESTNWGVEEYVSAKPQVNAEASVLACRPCSKCWSYQKIRLLPETVSTVYSA